MLSVKSFDVLSFFDSFLRANRLADLRGMAVQYKNAKTAEQVEQGTWTRHGCKPCFCKGCSQCEGSTCIKLYDKLD